MGTIRDYAKCPYCGKEESYIIDYNYRTDEEHCFCTNCGSHHDITLERDEENTPIFRFKKHYDFGEIKIRAKIDDVIVAAASIENKKQYETYNHYISKPKNFQECFSELCHSVEKYILARPERFANEIKDYRRGCYADRSGDKYSVALWRTAVIDIVDENDEHFRYINTKTKLNDTGIDVSECRYITDEKIRYGTFLVTDGKSTFIHSFDTEPSEAELQKLINDASVTEIKVVKNQETIIFK